MEGKKIRVGVLGATGAVGQRFVQMLQGHPWFEITALCASERSAGRTYADACRWNLRGGMPARLRDVTLLPCRAGLRRRARLQRAALEYGGRGRNQLRRRRLCRVQQRNHRYDDDVPLLIPEVNPEHLGLLDIQRRKRGWKGFIATNLNCSTTHLVSVLHPLHERFGVMKVFVVTMQAISGVSGRQQYGHPGQRVVPFISGEEKMEEKEPQKLMGVFDGERVRYADFVVSAHCNRRAGA